MRAPTAAHLRHGAETVGFLTRWRDDGTWQRGHDALCDQVRLLEGREPLPTAAVIDSQSVKAAETVGAARRGFDGGEKINGVKRVRRGLASTVRACGARSRRSAG